MSRFTKDIEFFSMEREGQCVKSLADFVYSRGGIINISDLNVISSILEDRNIEFYDKHNIISMYVEDTNNHTRNIITEYVNLKNKEVYDEGIIDFMNGVINFFSNVIKDIVSGIIKYAKKNWNEDPKIRREISESRKWIINLDSDDPELRADAKEKLNSFMLPVDDDSYELPEAIARLFINNYKLVARECLEKLEGMKERILADYNTLTKEQQENIPLSLVSKILNSLDKDVKTHLRNAGIDTKYWPADYVNMIGVYLDTKKAERKNHRNLRELSRNKLKSFLIEALNVKSTEAEILSKHIFNDVNAYISNKIDTIDKEILEDIEKKENTSIDNLGKDEDKEEATDVAPPAESNQPEKKQNKFGALSSIMEHIDPEYAEMFLKDWRRFDITFKTAKETFKYDDRTNRSIKTIIACFLTVPYIYKTKNKAIALKAMNRFISTVVRQLYNIYKRG